jgi:hypothetical protein
MLGGGTIMSPLTTGSLGSVFALFVTLFGPGPVASAGSITIPGLPGLLLGAAPSTATVGGASTDGANFFEFDSSPPSPFQAAVIGIKPGTMGTETASLALARPPTKKLPGFTTTNAVTKAGMNQTSSVFAIATAGATNRASAAVSGKFNIQIDPVLVNQGNASASMSFQLLFNGQTLFSAGSSLTDGLLTTSGTFSPGDFDVVTSGPSTIANLLTTSFSIPFEILGSDVNQDLSFEFDQTFKADATNGGFAQAGTVPEPSAMFPFSIGLASLFGYAWLRPKRVTA